VLGKFNFVKEKGTNIPFVRTPNQFPMVISILFNNWRVKKETAKTVSSSFFTAAAAAAAKTIFCIQLQYNAFLLFNWYVYFFTGAYLVLIPYRMKEEKRG
jgi:hypothetical protein